MFTINKTRKNKNCTTAKKPVTKNQKTIPW